MSKIKLRHIVSIGILFSLGNLILIMGINKEYIIQSVLISFVCSSSIIYFYQKLLNKYPNMSLFSIIKTKYNNLIGNIIIIIYSIFLLINGVQIIYSFLDFITSINQLDYESKTFIMFLNFLLLVYILNNSLNNLSRFTQIIFVLSSTMIFLLFVMGLKDINFTNLLPAMPSDFKDVFSSISVLIVYPFLEITLLFNVFSKMENTRSKKYIFYIINILSMLFIIWMCIEVIGILGSDYSCYLNYPYYVAISCINVSKIVIRIESLSFIIYYFCCFVKLVFIVYNLVIAFNTITNSRRKHYQPFLLIMHILSLIIFDNFSEMKTFMIYYSLVYIIFSICLVFFLFIKKDKKQENINIINHYA